jgi:Dolichyl-phosphate-mannose-protein mannosyltransferase
VAVEERQRFWALVTEFDGTRFATKYKKAAYVCMALLCVYVVIRGVVGAASRLFWFDELFTLTIAGQPSLHDMWTAIRSGFDSAPPLFYLVERVALGLSSNQQIALRLPSILAFPCILICLFVYAKKRNGELLACVCALLFLATSVFHTYLAEARPYSMVIACIAFALVCYQRMPGRGWTVLFGLALLLAESLHYYALFAMIPFWIAEGVALVQTKKFRWPTWVALICGLSPVAVLWPLLMTYKKSYGPNMFARPSFSAVRGYYGSFFLLTDNALGIAVATVAFAAIAWACLWPDKQTTRQSDEQNGNIVEAVLLLGFLALPVIAFVLASAVHGILLSRYVLAATIALVLGITIAASMAGRRATALFVLFVFGVVGVRELSFWRHRENDPFKPDFSAISANQVQQMQKFVQSAGHTDLPVVVSDCLLYSQFVYYLEPGWTSRLVFLTDEQREFRSSRADTNSKSMLAFSKFFPVRVKDYSEFTAANPDFLLYYEYFDWYVPALMQDGFSLELVASDNQGYGQVYLVRTKRASDGKAN